MFNQKQSSAFNFGTQNQNNFQQSQQQQQQQQQPKVQQFSFNNQANCQPASQQNFFSQENQSQTQNCQNPAPSKEICSIGSTTQKLFREVYDEKAKKDEKLQFSNILVNDNQKFYKTSVQMIRLHDIMQSRQMQIPDAYDYQCHQLFQDQKQNYKLVKKLSELRQGNNSKTRLTQAPQSKIGQGASDLTKSANLNASFTQPQDMSVRSNSIQKSQYQNSQTQFQANKQNQQNVQRLQWGQNQSNSNQNAIQPLGNLTNQFQSQANKQNNFFGGSQNQNQTQNNFGLNNFQAPKFDQSQQSQKVTNQQFPNFLQSANNQATTNQQSFNSQSQQNVVQQPNQASSNKITSSQGPFNFNGKNASNSQNVNNNQNVIASGFNPQNQFGIQSSQGSQNATFPQQNGFSNSNGGQGQAFGNQTQQQTMQPQTNQFNSRPLASFSFSQSGQTSTQPKSIFAQAQSQPQLNASSQPVMGIQAQQAQPDPCSTSIFACNQVPSKPIDPKKQTPDFNNIYVPGLAANPSAQAQLLLIPNDFDQQKSGQAQQQTHVNLQEPPQQTQIQKNQSAFHPFKLLQNTTGNNSGVKSVISQNLNNFKQNEFVPKNMDYKELVQQEIDLLKAKVISECELNGQINRPIDFVPLPDNFWYTYSNMQQPKSEQESLQSKSLIRESDYKIFWDQRQGKQINLIEQMIKNEDKSYEMSFETDNNANQSSMIRQNFLLDKSNLSNGPSLYSSQADVVNNQVKLCNINLIFKFNDTIHEKDIIINSSRSVNDLYLEAQSWLQSKFKIDQNLTQRVILYMNNLSISQDILQDIKIKDLGLQEQSEVQVMIANDDQNRIAKFDLVNLSALTQNYTTIPCRQTLRSMSSNELSKVQNFKISNESGTIQFKGQVDLRGVDLSKEVIIGKGFVDIYPEGTEKPQVGNQLNVNAKVTLYDIHPKAGQSKEKKEQKLKEQLKGSDARHIGYNFETREWYFEILKI